MRVFPTTMLVAVSVIVLAACEKREPTFGDVLQERGQGLATIGAQWNEGDALMSKGEKLVEKGDQQIEDGEEMIDDGETLIEKGRANRDAGEAMIEEGESKKRYAEQQYRARPPETSPQQ